jgi:hypothetical protein
MNFLSGDFRFFWLDSLRDFATFPLAWDSSLNTGIGISQLSSLWITGFFNFTAFFSNLGLSWNLIQIFFWIIPAILLSFFSSFFLFKKLFKLKIFYSILAGIIYVFNTYFLMILSGGQLGVSLSYSIVPLVFFGFIKLLEKPSFKNTFLSGLILGFQITFDPRITYVTLTAIFIYLLFNFLKFKNIKNFGYILLSFFIAVLVNSFWIIPLILTKNLSLPVGFDSVEGFKFFSFARLENALSLLHPNWPENIFGKIYFLRPEFLILPIIAFSSLLFKKNKTVLFFSLVALVGIFFTKGANDPCGFVNEFLFQHLPGMKMFRDPTKWYILIALSYSILIPFSISSICRFFKRYIRFEYLFLIFFVFYLIFLMKPLLSYQINNLSKFNQIPNEYVELKNFITKQPNFFRTLWVPEWQRLGFFSNNHPAIGRQEIFDTKNINKLVENFEKNKVLLQEFGIKYVIIPYDSQEEIFLKDRKYDEKSYLRTIKKINSITWLKRVEGFNRIIVFENSVHKDHFWSPNKNINIDYQYANPAKYNVYLKNAKKGDVLVFSESFDGNWRAKDESSNNQVASIKYDKFLNSFILLKDGNYVLGIYYQPQKFVNFGLWISGIMLLTAIGFVSVGYVSKKW